MGVVEMSHPQVTTISVICLGLTHAEKVFVNGSCPLCENITMAKLRVRLSFLIREGVTSLADHLGPSAMHKAMVASTEGDMGTTMGAFRPGQSPRASHSLSCSLHLVEFLDKLGGSSYGVSKFSLGTPYEDEVLIAALSNMVANTPLCCTAAAMSKTGVPLVPLI